MRTSFTVGDMTVHRIVEQEAGFTPILEFLPSLSRELLDENRSWLQPAALDQADMAVLCFQSYVVKTPRALPLERLGDAALADKSSSAFIAEFRQRTIAMTAGLAADRQGCAALVAKSGLFPVLVLALDTLHAVAPPWPQPNDGRRFTQSQNSM